MKASEIFKRQRSFEFDLAENKFGENCAWICFCLAISLYTHFAFMGNLHKNKMESQKGNKFCKKVMAQNSLAKQLGCN